jgi:hypothetical protein
MPPALNSAREKPSNPLKEHAMTKLGIFSPIVALVAALAVATFTAPASADDVTPCVHKDLKTDLVKNACTKGGQAEAKVQMKTFMKSANIKTCNACHSKLAPSYDLKDDAYDQFKKAGGK